MTAIKMDGEALAGRILDDLRLRIAALEERGITPGLGTVLVGDDGPSAKYVSMKHEDCAKVGMVSVDKRLPATATQAEVESTIAQLNTDPSVDAYIVQYPFPAGLDYTSAVLGVDPAKDADGLHPVNLGLLVMGEDGAAGLHSSRHPRSARGQWRSPGRPQRRGGRTRPDHRPPARQPVGAQAARAATPR